MPVYISFLHRIEDPPTGYLQFSGLLHRATTNNRSDIKTQEYGGKTNSCFKSNACGRNCCFCKNNQCNESCMRCKDRSNSSSYVGSAATILTGSRKPLDSSLPSSKCPKFFSLS